MNTLRFSVLVVLGVAIAGIVPMLEHGRVQQATAPSIAARATPAKPATVDPQLRPLPARWRLAPMDAMQHVLLPLSQILIAHRDADRGFSLSSNSLEEPWLQRVTPKATRTRQEALVLARRIQAQLKADPEAFAQLATRYSDDPASQQLGGRMGSLSAAPMHPSVLDALGAIAPGEVSQLVESGYGFHLWRLHRAPAATQVGGTRVVLPYTGVLGSERLPQTRLPTREQALQLAQRIAEQARERPAELLEIARRIAPLLQPALTGGIGLWSTHDAGPDRAGAERELELLSRLAIDEISAPLDGPYGVQLWRRDASAAAASTYAYQALFFRFDPEAAQDSDQSRRKALGLAQAALAELREHPQRFAELQQEYCCKEVIQWTAGFVEPELGRVLSELAPGQIASEPLIEPFYVAVVRRAEPTKPQPHTQASAFELPRPHAPDIALLLEHGDGAQLARAIRELGADAKQHLQLDEQHASAFSALFSQLADVIEPSPPGPERRTVLSQSMQKLQELLGAPDYMRYMQYMNEWTSTRIMRGS